MYVYCVEFKKVSHGKNNTNTLIYGCKKWKLLEITDSERVISSGRQQINSQYLYIAFYSIPAIYVSEENVWFIREEWIIQLICVLFNCLSWANMKWKF